MLLIVGVLSSCGKKIKKTDSISLKAGESGITINEDNVIYQIKEAFDKDYYNEKTLKEMINTEIEDFNKEIENKDKKIKLTDFKVKDDVASLIITFPDIDTFAGYVNEKEKPIDEMLAYKGEFKNLDVTIYGDCESVLLAKDAIGDVSEDNEEKIDENLLSPQEAAIDDDTQMLAINMPLKIKCKKDILAVSKEVKVEDDLAITTEGMCYIFFK